MGVEFVEGQEVYDTERGLTGVVFRISQDTKPYVIWVKFENHSQSTYTAEGFRWVGYEENHPEWKLQPARKLQIEYALTL